MRRKMVLGLSGLLFLMAIGAQGATAITTATGNGADAYITNDELSGPTVTHGSEGVVEIRIYSTRFRATLLRFDLRSVGGDRSGALLSLWQTVSPRARTINVYGVNGANEAWTESTVCYNNAPGFRAAALGSYSIDPNAVTLLGTLSLPATSSTEVTSATASLNFDNFISQDKNGLITLIVVDEAAANNFTWDFASKETTLGGVRVHPPRLTFPNARHAKNPQPAIDAEVLPSVTTLSWTNPDPNSAGGIITSDVYFGTTEPNLSQANYGLTKIAAGTTATTLAIPSALTAPATYYWIVDSYDSSSTPMFLGTGGQWSFNVVARPIILTQPAAQTEELTATFSITVASDSAVTYTWYKSTDNANNTLADDVQVGTNSATLTLTGLTRTDDAYYYCKVYNTYGQAYAVSSNTARLTVKRQVAYWTLDGLVGGQYQDSSGEGHPADPNGVPNFVAGAKGNGVAISTATGGWANAGTWNPSDLTGQLTLSFWLKWNGSNGAGQGIIAKSNSFSASNMMWQVLIDSTNRIGIQRAGAISIYSAAANMKVGEWDYVAVTFNGTNATIYRVNAGNDFFVTNTGAFSFGTGTAANLVLGCVTLGADTLNGALDDVQIFNYAKDAVGVDKLYNEVLPRNFCALTLGTAEFNLDSNSNCRVDMADFAAFAQTWMQCGLYPNCP